MFTIRSNVKVLSFKTVDFALTIIMLTGFDCGTFASTVTQDMTKLLFGKIFSSTPEKCIEGTRLNITSRNLYLPCYECFCQDNTYICFISKGRQECNLLKNYEEQESCCDKCKGCFKNKYYESSYEWTEENNPCEILKCNNGVIMKSSIDCSSCTEPKLIAPEITENCCTSCSGHRKYSLTKKQSSHSKKDSQKNKNHSKKKEKCIEGTRTPMKINSGYRNIACFECFCHQNDNNYCQKSICYEECYYGSMYKTYTERENCCNKCLGCYQNKYYESNSQWTEEKNLCKVFECSSGVITESLVNSSSCNNLKPIVPEISDFIEYQKDQSKNFKTVRHELEDTEIEELDDDNLDENEVKDEKTAADDKSDEDDEIKVREFENEEKYEYDEEELENDKAGVDETEYEEPEDDGVCKVNRGSLFKTFDNTIFAISGTCNYTLVSDCKKENFDIQLKVALVKNNSMMKTVLVTHANKKVELGVKYVKVNNRFTNLPYRLKGKLSVMEKSGDIVISLKNGMKIFWNYEMGLLEVRAPKKFKNKLCGLCGNFDFISSNDLTTREGILVEDPSTFAQSWSAGEEVCYDFKNLVNERCDTKRSERICSYLKGSIFGTCDKKIRVTTYYEECLEDVCRCSSSDKKCHCRSFEKYVHDCRALGIRMTRWKKLVGC